MSLEIIFNEVRLRRRAFRRVETKLENDLLDRNLPLDLAAPPYFMCSRCLKIVQL